MRRALLICLLSPVLCSCVRLSWTRNLGFVPVQDAQLDGLEPGTTQVEECLTNLGGPLRTWELPHGGFAMAFGWRDNRVLGGTVSVPITQFYSASFNYNDDSLKVHGVVLSFDYDGTLQFVERGYLNDLILPLQRRPTFVDFDGEHGGGEDPRRSRDA